MNAPLASIAPASFAKPKLMEVNILGKVDSIRRYDGKTFTRVLTPAADAYSKPQVLEIRSDKKIGDRGEEVTVLCRIGGYTRKAFRVTDKDSGEQTMVTPVDMTLDALDQ